MRHIILANIRQSAWILHTGDSNIYPRKLEIFWVFLFIIKGRSWNHKIKKVLEGPKEMQFNQFWNFFSSRLLFTWFWMPMMPKAVFMIRIRIKKYLLNQHGLDLDLAGKKAYNWSSLNFNPFKSRSKYKFRGLNPDPFGHYWDPWSGSAKKLIQIRNTGPRWSRIQTCTILIQIHKCKFLKTAPDIFGSFFLPWVLALDFLAPPGQGLFWCTSFLKLI